MPHMAASLEKRGAATCFTAFYAMIQLRSNAFRDRRFSSRVLLPNEAHQFLSIPPESRLHLSERLSLNQPVIEIASVAEGIHIPVMPPLTAYYFRVSIIEK